MLEGKSSLFMCETRSVVVRTRAGLFCLSPKKKKTTDDCLLHRVSMANICFKGDFWRFSLEFQSSIEFEK